ncbi:MAG: SGNH/GDSL hydrolase family protein [Verrucomicrobia bacterium]|jgi:hypothetical protein|nr:SGNH/GDSL hydrolase family protein [Verrucomicrobiota bacterium]
MAGKASAARIAGGIGILTGVGLAPPLFARVFALGTLLSPEILGLWVFCYLLMVVSVWLVWRPSRVDRRVVAVFLGMLLLVGLELGVRLFVNVFRPEARDGLAWMADRTRPEFMQLTGHPFLQYVGNPRASNNFGFSGDRDFSYEKEPGTVRVVCLGGSTTESYWPFMMEVFLNSTDASRTRRFEVLNLGKQGYTSLHILINFVINGIEFSPDYVVIHSGWNDGTARDRSWTVKRDYSDLFKVLEIPPIPDKWALRTSVIYRLVQKASGTQPAWADSRNALEKDPYEAPPTPYQNEEELLPFQHNIEKIVDFAEQRSVHVVLTTLPHSTDPQMSNFEDARHIDQCNAVMRRLHRAREATASLVDLDKILTGQNVYYADVAHTTTEGDRMKAVHIGTAIIKDIESRQAEQ